MAGVPRYTGPSSRSCVVEVVTVASLVSVVRPPRDRLASASMSSDANRLRRPPGAGCDTSSPRLT